MSIRLRRWAIEWNIAWCRFRSYFSLYSRSFLISKYWIQRSMKGFFKRNVIVFIIHIYYSKMNFTFIFSCLKKLSKSFVINVLWNKIRLHRDSIQRTEIQAKINSFTQLTLSLSLSLSRRLHWPGFDSLSSISYTAIGRRN